ncbi:hypothetical protein ACIRU3_34735 [Streptomyces sp. NPDC101151]|uniref:hypothetical protein n=1 Tax=Streptomyces sp. NPDC101151 TaxID=3366115 RepID=UPI0038000927
MSVDPTGAETRYTHDEAGRPTAITDALGHTRTVAYDPAGLPVATTDELGHTRAIRRDSFGRIFELTDPLGHATRLGRTSEGNPSWRRHPDGSRESWAWDAEGNLLGHTDAAGNTTHHTPGPFDGAGGQSPRLCTHSADLDRPPRSFPLQLWHRRLVPGGRHHREGPTVAGRLGLAETR